MSRRPRGALAGGARSETPVGGATAVASGDSPDAAREAAPAPRGKPGPGPKDCSGAGVGGRPADDYSIRQRWKLRLLQGKARSPRLLSSTQAPVSRFWKA
ncbi:hypothetical protein GCM10022245_48030 [Streptomyces mayteni]